MIGFLNLGCMTVPWKGNENEVMPHLIFEWESLVC